MKAKFLALVVVATGLVGCSTGYVPPHSPSYGPGPAHDTEFRDGRPGMFGDLTWSFDMKGGDKVSPAAAPATASSPAAAAAPAAAASAAEQEEFKKWRESAGATERQEFEEWRAWQEWKRKNPK